MRRLLLGLALLVVSCGAAVGAARPPLVAQWSAADCDYAIQTLANGVWDDRHAAYVSAAQNQPGLAAAYFVWVHHHEDEKSAAKVHCGSTRVAPVTDAQAIATLEQARKIHFDGATLNASQGRPQQALNDFENVDRYDRLIGLFRDGKCPDAYCSYIPGTTAAGDATQEN